MTTKPFLLMVRGKSGIPECLVSVASLTSCSKMKPAENCQ